VSLTTDGLVIPRLADLRSAFRSRAATLLGAAYATGAESPLGELIDAFSAPFAAGYELLQQVYNAFSLNSATGASLDNVGDWNGVAREPATKSTAVLTLGGTVGIVVPAGREAGIENGTSWITLADATIGAGGTVTVAAEASEFGPLEASAGTIDQIVTAVSGWATVTNASAAAVGQDIESDSTYRARIRNSRAIVGGSNDASLRSQLENEDDIIAATVISNRTNLTDGFGIPPHAFRAVIWPATADPEVIAALIWTSDPSGIEPDGAVSATVEDTKGNIQTVKWSWADEQVLYLDAIITRTSAYPADGDAQVEAALAAAFSALSVGDDVVVLDGICAVKAAVPGILTFVLEAKIGSVPTPSDIVNIAIDRTQKVTLDTANITVVST